LETHGVDIAAAIEVGKYISVDAGDALSAFMVNGVPDPARCFKFFGDLIVTAAEAAKGEQARVAVFGEGVQPSVHRVTQRRRFGSKDLRIG
jgi:hypothetical protein